LQVSIGYVPDDDVFADEYFGDDGEIFGTGGHNDANIGDDVQIDTVFGLVDADAFKLGREVASDGANGDDTEGDLRSEPGERLDARERAEGNGDTV